MELWYLDYGFLSSLVCGFMRLLTFKHVPMAEAIAVTFRLSAALQIEAFRDKWALGFLGVEAHSFYSLSLVFC